MMERRLLAVDNQARIFAFAWMLRDLHDSPYILDRDQLKWVYQELLATFHLTDQGMEAARPVYAELKQEAATAAAKRAEAKQRREDERRVRIEARRARAGAVTA
jgi:hypothetical protein